MSTVDLLEQYLEPVLKAFTPDVAQKLLDVTPGADVTARVEELAAKANAGTLSEGERDEYRHYVDIGNLIGLLKAKARRILAAKP